VQIDIATPLGGQPPIDPKSEDPSAATEDTKRFDADTALLDKLSKTLKLSDVNQADYDAVFYPGGHGPLWDLTEDKNSIALIEAFYTHKKPIGFVCHAPGVLKNVKINGEFLVKGKKVTGFANTEEEAIGLTKVVPFLLEDVLQQNGASYSKAADWNPYAVEDGLLITGQNPASSKLVAEKLLNQLTSKK
jgi:putative intracellular protease/amidase